MRIKGFLSIIAAGAAVVVLSLRWRHDPQPQFDATDHDRQPSDWQEPDRSSKPAPHQGGHSQEEQHRRWERRYWFATLLLTLVIAIGAGLSARYAYYAAYEAHRQADIAQRVFAESDRPLLYMSIRTSVVQDSVAIPEVSIVNIGIKPAIIRGLYLWNVPIGEKYYVPSFTCLQREEGVIAAGERFNVQCPVKGKAYIGATQHVYGIVVYRSITGIQWRQRASYYLSPNSNWKQTEGINENEEVEDAEQHVEIPSR